jgi:circadian clock protein KaiC
MVDGIIELSDELREQRSLRFLQVRKMRGTAPVRGRHTMEIGNDGIVVRRRFETQLLPVTEQPETTTEPPRMSFGIARLDQMLHGGVPASSVTMLLGPSGTGKTALGLQFLAEGARRGEPGVHFGFYERPQRLLVKSRQLGLGLETAVQSGLVQLVWHRPVEGIIDQLSEHLIGEVRRTGARRVFVDGINGFELSVDTPERIRDVYAGLASELEKAGVTTIYTMESIDLLGPRIELPIGGLSAITHNILVLRHVELEATLRRSLCILKLRDSGHESIICELRITPTGLDVVDSFGRATNILSGTAYLGPDAPPHTVGPDPGTRTPGGRKA